MNFRTGDRGYYFMQGRLIGEGHFFKNGLLYQQTGELADSAAHPPGFSLLLGFWSWIGVTTILSQLFMLGIVGGATVVAIAVLTRRIADDRISIIAASIATVYPFLLINDATLLSESLYQLTITTTMISAYAYIDKPSNSKATIVGIMVGAAALVRSEAILLALLLSIPLIWLAREYRHKLKTRLTHLLISGIATLAVISPWVAYLNIVHEEPLLLQSATGWALLSGSCDSVWYGDNLGRWTDCATERKEELKDEFNSEFPGIDWTDASIYGHPLYDASRLDSFFLSHAIEYILDNISRYPIVIIARVARMFGLYRPIDTWERQYFWNPPWKHYAVPGQIMYTILVVPAVIGAWLLHRQGKRLTPLIAMWFLVAIAAAVTFAVPRYRVPVDITVIILASIAFGYWSDRFGIHAPWRCRPSAHQPDPGC